MRTFGFHAALVLLGLLAWTIGCFPSKSSNEVVVYCALDREFSQPILEQYGDKLGARVLPKFDVESSKTVGLASAIIAEQQRPRCDLFWNNEILHTLRLKKLGLLEPFEVENAAQWPEMFRDSEACWYGFAARARVLLVNTKVVASDERPTSMSDLVDAKWRGKVGMAKPLFGTTATHAAVLFAQRGEEEATKFFQAFKENGRLFSGNKQVAQAVSSGEIAFGVTDTDDAMIEIEKGQPVAIVFPDQADDQSGTLLIPNTLCLIKGAPHQRLATELAKKIVSAETENTLAMAESNQIPLNQSATKIPKVLLPGDIKWMQVDFEKAADQWEKVSKRLTEIFDL